MTLPWASMPGFAVPEGAAAPNVADVVASTGLAASFGAAPQSSRSIRVRLALDSYRASCTRATRSPPWKDDDDAFLRQRKTIRSSGSTRYSAASRELSDRTSDR